MNIAADGYTAGLIDGEGCLEVEDHTRNRRQTFVLRLTIALRADAVGILRLLHQQFGGNLYYKRVTDGQREHMPGTNPKYHWRICARADVLRLIEYLDEYPLIIKAEEYKVWREAAMFYYRHAVIPARGRSNPPWLTGAMKAYDVELKRLKKFQAKGDELPRDFEIPQKSLFE